MQATLSIRPKPLLRGWSHVAAALLALPAGVLLVARATEGMALGAAIYMTSLTVLLTTSATYHTPTWRPSVRRVLRRIDHAMIYFLVAGSYTPFCFAMDPATQSVLLPLVWIGAGVGVLKSIFWIDAPRSISVLAYSLVGCSVLPWLPELYSAIGPQAFGLVVAGGLFYLAGGLIYARKRPDPAPTVFGYHEIFHVCVIAASACHYAAVWIMVG